MKSFRWLFAFVLLVGVGLSANASAADKIGVVVLHGKWGSPGRSYLAGWPNFLEPRGFLVDQPEMPWSRQRTYDKGRRCVVAEIDAAVRSYVPRALKNCRCRSQPRRRRQAPLRDPTAGGRCGTDRTGRHPQSETFLDNYSSPPWPRHVPWSWPGGKADAPVSFNDLKPATATAGCGHRHDRCWIILTRTGPLNSYVNAARQTSGNGVVLLMAAPTQEAEITERAEPLDLRETGGPRQNPVGWKLTPTISRRRDAAKKAVEPRLVGADSHGCLPAICR